MSKNNVKGNSDRAPRQDHTKFGGANRFVAAVALAQEWALCEPHHSHETVSAPRNF
jgi:hypothetical protein